eukprot:3621657-Pleurochrysis_carterae.AAC.1
MRRFLPVASSITDSLSRDVRGPLPLDAQTRVCPTPAHRSPHQDTNPSTPSPVAYSSPQSLATPSSDAPVPPTV